MPATLDDVLSRFVPPADATEVERHIRVAALATALTWLARLPNGPGKHRAISMLADAMDVACQTYSAN